MSLEEYHRFSMLQLRRVGWGWKKKKTNKSTQLLLLLLFLSFFLSLLLLLDMPQVQVQGPKGRARERAARRNPRLHRLPRLDRLRPPRRHGAGAAPGLRGARGRRQDERRARDFAERCKGALGCIQWVYVLWKKCFCEHLGKCYKTWPVATFCNIWQLFENKFDSVACQIYGRLSYRKS